MACVKRKHAYVLASDLLVYGVSTVQGLPRTERPRQIFILLSLVGLPRLESQPRWFATWLMAFPCWRHPRRKGQQRQHDAVQAAYCLECGCSFDAQISNANRSDTADGTWTRLHVPRFMDRSRLRMA